MFTGLVKDIGTIRSATRNREGVLFSIESPALINDIKVDDSVSVNGACQTATRIENNCFYFQSVHTTLEKTTLGSLKIGEKVNLELALKASDRLGGHIVQGHVNDVGTIQKIEGKGNNYLIGVKVHPSQLKYIVKEGSITVDGISLTVSDVDRGENTFFVSIIPHTYHQTIIHYKKIGERVNIEVDILGKYIENLLKPGHDSISEEWLRSKGF